MNAEKIGSFLDRVRQPLLVAALRWRRLSLCFHFSYFSASLMDKALPPRSTVPRRSGLNWQHWFASRSKPRCLQLLHEFVKAVSRRPLREKLLDLHLQNLREIDERFVVHVREARFDFGDAATADVEACDLQLRGEIRLRPAQRVATTANLRADVILVTHTVLRSCYAVF